VYFVIFCDTRSPFFEFPIVIANFSWHRQVGNQRDWVWRGWQTRYTFLRAANITSDRAPFLLVHGFGASIASWRNNIPALAEQHPVYALDMLGFGTSEKAVAGYNVELWSEQLYDFWRTFIQKPVILVGNSIGSLVCLAAAARYPEMVQGMVMLNLPDSSVLSLPLWLKQAIAPMQPIKKVSFSLLSCLFLSPIFFNSLFRVIRSRALLKIWARQAYATSAAITKEVVEIFSHPTFDRGAASALRAMIQSPKVSGRDYSAKTLIPNLKIPMLLIWGKQDRMVPPKLAPMIARLNPQITFAEIDNAGHCPHDERPEQVNQLILDWIAKQEVAKPMG